MILIFLAISGLFIRKGKNGIRGRGGLVGVDWFGSYNYLSCDLYVVNTKFCHSLSQMRTDIKFKMKEEQEHCLRKRAKKTKKEHSHRSRRPRSRPALPERY